MADENTDLRCYLTNAGIAAENNSIQLNRSLNVTEMVFGSGLLADEKDPREQTAMIKEEYAVPCALLFDEDTPTLLVFKGDLPADVGGFYINEVGIRLEDGTIYGYARGKGDYKPTLEQGATDSVRYAVEMYSSNADNVVAKIDLSSVYADYEDIEATKKYADDKVQEHIEDDDPHSQYMQHGDYGFGGSEFVPIAYGKLLSDIKKTEYRLVSGGAIPSDSPEPTAALVFTKWANASNANQVWERLTSDKVPVIYRRVYRNGVWGGWVKDPTLASIQATYEKITNLKDAAYKNVGLDVGNVMPVGAFGLGVTNQISLEDDLDSILTNGFYYVPPNHPQSPTAGAGYVIVPHTTLSSNTVQLFFDAANDEVYFRRITTDTTFEWQKLWSSGNTPANLAGTGYLKLPNGLIFQWGTVTGIGTPGSKTVILPIAFTTAAYSATCAHKGASGGNATVSSFSLTQITLFNESTSAGSSICYWIVGK